MAIDPSKFHLVNITDACAVWNILSSKMLYTTAYSVRCEFYITNYVCYECLYKPRKEIKKEDIELQIILKEAQKKNRFKTYHLDIEDLQQISILEKRKYLGKGELSSIAFAIKIKQAFLTDDKKARKLAASFMNPMLVQTTPQLLGWMIYNGSVLDGDKDTVIAEHEQYNRPLKIYFEEMYKRALEYRLMANRRSSN